LHFYFFELYFERFSDSRLSFYLEVSHFRLYRFVCYSLGKSKNLLKTITFLNNNMTSNDTWIEIHQETHSAPHIPGIQGELVYGPVSNTNITTGVFFVFVIVFIVFARLALHKQNSKLKTGLLHLIGMLDTNMKNAFWGDAIFARRFFPLLAGILTIILFGNLFGLLIDWVGVINEDILHYLRPIHSDLNTTLVLAGITVLFFLGLSVKYGGLWGTLKGYFFNFSGNGFGEKCINVFVGWLHLLSIPSMWASLALRLFGNIFAGVVLIGIIGYLWAMATSSFLEIGRLLTLPLWFFEVFVSLIQAGVFYMLMISYFNQSREVHH